MCVVVVGFDFFEFFSKNNGRLIHVRIFVSNLPFFLFSAAVHTQGDNSQDTSSVHHAIVPLGVYRVVGKMCLCV